MYNIRTYYIHRLQRIILVSICKILRNKATNVLDDDLSIKIYLKV